MKVQLFRMFPIYSTSLISTYRKSDKKSEKVIIITETFYDWELFSSFIDDLITLTVRETALIIRWPWYVHTFNGKKQSAANDINPYPANVENMVSS